MTKTTRNKIPNISSDRLDNSNGNGTIEANTKEARQSYAFIKDKELTKPFSIRIPIDMYKRLRRYAFEKDEKMNQIIIGLLREFMVDK